MQTFTLPLLLPLSSPCSMRSERGRQYSNVDWATAAVALLLPRVCRRRRVVNAVAAAVAVVVPVALWRSQQPKQRPRTLEKFEREMHKLPVETLRLGLCFCWSNLKHTKRSLDSDKILMV